MYVGIFTRPRPPARVTAAVEPLPTSPSTLPVASPFHDSHLADVVWKDIFGSDVVRPVGRSAAMKLPPLSRGRNLLVSTICRFPLVELEGDQPVAELPTWMQGTAGTTTPQHRMAWTVDDLIFHGWSCWWRNGMTRINQKDWRFDGDGHVLVNDQPVRHDEVVLFPGLHEGVLEYGSDVVRDTQALYRIVRQRIKNPSATTNLNQTEGEALTDDEIDKLIARHTKARQSEDGGVGFTGRGIEVQELGKDTDGQLLIDARNASAVDLARVIGVSASQVDATAPKASLNYETSQGKNLEFIDIDLALYMTPITARLSMDDIVAPGHRVAFDTGDFTSQAPAATGPVTED